MSRACNGKDAGGEKKTDANPATGRSREQTSKSLEGSPPSIDQIGRATREFLVHPGQCPPFRQHGVRLAGLSHTGKGFRFSRPHPPMLQILVCLNGYGKVWMRGSWHRCGQGDAYITPARIPHAYEGVKWEVGWIHYEPEIWGFVRLEEPVLQKSDPRLFGQILQGLYYEAGHRAALPMLEHWTELLHEEARRMMESDRTERLWALWQAVQADLAAPWSVTQLASRAGMGGEHLRVLCRKEMGRSPMEQVAYLRMHHAVSLLTAGHKAHVVAETVGYDNAFAFSTAFKRVMGRSPREYRNA